MLVRAARSLAVTVKGQFVTIEAGPTQTVSDDIKDAPEFDNLVKSGELFVYQAGAPTPGPEVLPVDTTGTKKPADVIQDAKTGKAAEAAKPVTA